MIGIVMKHLRYLRYILRHKWFVFVECYRLGIPWQGISHDLSKFRPSEWFPYAEYFYGPRRPSWKEFGDVPRNAYPGGFSEDVREDFDFAWLKHQHRNPHHWQHFVLANDDGPVFPLPMPDRYRKEMLADWKGAGKANGKPDTKVWYKKQRELGRQNLHPETRAWIEAQLCLP